jgi:hypothetical protein
MDRSLMITCNISAVYFNIVYICYFMDEKKKYIVEI